MADAENTNAGPQSDQDTTTEAQPQEPHSEPHSEPPANKPDKPNHLSFSIWPPAGRTREAVVKRLIETLSTPSVLSNRYGTVPQEEASAAARVIEEEAFATAGGSAAADDDGIQILQVYSKEISKRMLEAVKARTSSVSAAPDGASQPATESPATESAAPATTATESEDAQPVDT